MRISDWSSDVCSSDLLPLTVLMAALLLLVWRCHLRPSVRELAPTWVAGRLPAAWDTGAAAGLRETLAISGGRASWPQLALVIVRSEEHTSELQSLMRISYAVFCLKKKKEKQYHHMRLIYQKSKR